MEFSYRAYFSAIHIQAAALFAMQAKAIEVARADTAKSATDHEAYVVGAVLSSVAFLEAAINELFADASDRWFHPRSRSKRKLPSATVRLMANMWEHGIPRTARYSVLEKYAIALILARKKPTDKGAPVWQATEVLIRLRNALIHYEPTDEPELIFEDDKYKPPDGEHKLAKALRGRFPLNSLAAPNHPYFPDQILGYGCAAWAVNTSIAFADEFAQRLGSDLSHWNYHVDLVTE